MKIIKSKQNPNLINLSRVISIYEYSQTEDCSYSIRFNFKKSSEYWYFKNEEIGKKVFNSLNGFIYE